MDINNLKPCPFCGSSNVVYKYTCGAGYVVCKKCESYGSLTRDIKDANERKIVSINKWNQRSL